MYIVTCPENLSINEFIREDVVAPLVPTAIAAIVIVTKSNKPGGFAQRRHHCLLVYRRHILWH